MLARIRKAKEENESGFTLIELLVVVIIIGILAAIAIPTFLNQREKAWTRALKADLHNNAVKMEEWKDENGSYETLANATFKTSDNNSDTTVVSADTDSFCLRVSSTQTFTNDDTAQVGGFPSLYFDSAVGKPSLTACT